MFCTFVKMMTIMAGPKATPIVCVINNSMYALSVSNDTLLVRQAMTNRIEIHPPSPSTDILCQTGKKHHLPQQHPPFLSDSIYTPGGYSHTWA